HAVGIGVNRCPLTFSKIHTLVVWAIRGAKATGEGVQRVREREVLRVHWCCPSAGVRRSDAFDLLLATTAEDDADTQGVQQKADHNRCKDFAAHTCYSSPVVVSCARESTSVSASILLAWSRLVFSSSALVFSSCSTRARRLATWLCSCCCAWWVGVSVWPAS